MTDYQFLTKMREYIERAEQTLENEYGSCRSIKQLIEAKEMPKIYLELLRRIVKAQT